MAANPSATWPSTYLWSRIPARTSSPDPRSPSPNSQVVSLTARNQAGRLGRAPVAGATEWLIRAPNVSASAGRDASARTNSTRTPARIAASCAIARASASASTPTARPHDTGHGDCYLPVSAADIKRRPARRQADPRKEGRRGGLHHLRLPGSPPRISQRAAPVICSTAYSCQSPRTPFEQVGSPVPERDARAGDQVGDGAADEHLAGLRRGRHPRAGMDRDARQPLTHRLDLAGVQADPDFDAQRADRIAHRAGAEAAVYFCCLEALQKQRAIRPQATALAVFAALAGLIALAIIG